MPLCRAQTDRHTAISTPMFENQSFPFLMFAKVGSQGDEKDMVVGMIINELK